MTEITNRGRWTKGRSGNPKGRPPRRLTETLRALGEMDTYAALPNRRLLAQFVWEAVSCGSIQLMGGRKIELTGKEWVELVKWLHSHLEGAYQSSTEADIKVADDELGIQKRLAARLAQLPRIPIQTRDDFGIDASALPPSVRAELEALAQPVAEPAKPAEPVETPPPAEDAHLRDPDWLAANLYLSLQPDERRQIWGDPPTQNIRFT